MMTKSEHIGVLAAILSSMLGGTAAAITRYMVGVVDPVTLAAVRFGIAFLLILPIALALRSKWPTGRDWLAVAGLGVLFFAVFFYIYNVSHRLHDGGPRLTCAVHAATDHDARCCVVEG